MDTSQLLEVFATCDTCGEQSSVNVDLATWQESVSYTHLRAHEK